MRGTHQWVKDTVFLYYFVYYVIKGYTGQVHIKLGAIFQKMQHIFKEKKTSAKEMCIQSDNTT